MKDALSLESRIREAIPCAPDLSGYDLTYRPAVYWDQPVHSLVATVLPEHARQAAAMGDPSLVSEGEQRMVEGVHPAYMSGGYLPPLSDLEVEIARVVMDSTTGDVVSFRARPGEDGGVEYVVEDEYADEGWVYSFAPSWSAKPLTFGELLLLVASACREDLPRVIDLGKAQDVQNFLAFSSAYYPQLRQFFLDEEAYWQRGCCDGDDIEG